MPQTLQRVTSEPVLSTRSRASGRSSNTNVSPADPERLRAAQARIFSRKMYGNAMSPAVTRTSAKQHAQAMQTVVSQSATSTHAYVPILKRVMPHGGGSWDYHSGAATPKSFHSEEAAGINGPFGTATSFSGGLRSHFSPGSSM